METRLNSVNSLFSSIINIQISTSLQTQRKAKNFLSYVPVFKKEWYLRSSSVNPYTDRYLHAESHHYPAQKQSAINSLVHRAFTITDKEHLQTEFNHLKLALEISLQKNDKKDIIKTINKHVNKTIVSDTIRRKDPIHSPIWNNLPKE